MVEIWQCVFYMSAKCIGFNVFIFFLIYVEYLLVYTKKHTLNLVFIANCSHFSKESTIFALYYLLKMSHNGQKVEQNQSCIG